MAAMIRWAVLSLALLLPGPSVRAAEAVGAYADLPGVRLWYTDTGGTSVPIVLMHDNTGTSVNSAEQNEAFSWPAAASSRSIGADGARA